MRASSSIRACCMILGLCGLIRLTGCGPMETPATFTPGGGANQLDGGVLANDGTSYSISTDGQEVDISAESRRLVFDTATGVSIPKEILTLGGHRLQFNSESRLITTFANVLGGQTIVFPVPEDTNSMFDGFGRTASQTLADCESVRDAVDQFCDAFIADSDAALTTVVDVALDEARNNGIPEIAYGTIEGIIREFFDELKLFCEAWDEVRGFGVDPCNAG